MIKAILKLMVFILITTLIILPFLPVNSAEFTIDLVAALVSLFFIVYLIVFKIRKREDK